VGNGTVTINADVPPQTETGTQPYTSATITASPGDEAAPGPDATFTGLANGTEYTFSQTLVNDCGTTTYAVGQAIPEDVVITAPQQNSATVGQAYSQTFMATGAETVEGPQGYGWQVTAGPLPPGLSLDVSTGTLSGTPTTAGQWSFTVWAEDAETSLSDTFPPLEPPATVDFTLTVTD
jgi:hypothetical protein